MGKMYFDRTLEDWIGYKMRQTCKCKYDLMISAFSTSGAQRVKAEKKETSFNDKKFFRRYNKEIRR